MLQYRLEAGLTKHSIFRREVRPTYDGFQVRCQPNAHWPAAMTSCSLHKNLKNVHNLKQALRIDQILMYSDLHEVHVHSVNVRSFLTISFNSNVVFIKNATDFDIFKRFSLHDMTPVTRRITDRKKNKFVFISSPSKSFFAPRKPITCRQIKHIRNKLFYAMRNSNSLPIYWIRCVL